MRWERTVNPSADAFQVRILDPPPCRNGSWPARTRSWADLRCVRRCPTVSGCSRSVAPYTRPSARPVHGMPEVVMPAAARRSWMNLARWGSVASRRPAAARSRGAPGAFLPTTGRACPICPRGPCLAPSGGVGLDAEGLGREDTAPDGEGYPSLCDHGHLG